MNTKLLATGILLITLSGTFCIISKNSRDDSAVNCSGQITVTRNTDKLAMNVLFFIDDNVGTIYLKGVLKNNGKTYILNRSIYATITRKNNHYRFITQKIFTTQELPSSEQPFSDILPKYLQSAASPQDFFIHKINASGYIFTNGYLPSLYCKKIT